MSEQNLARLFVLCARPWPGHDAGEEVLRLASKVRDWDRALALADDEGILPLLYWSLRDRPGSVPSSVLGALRTAFLRNMARTAQIYKELELFLESVRRAGIRAALTKGGRLALELYPEPALRPFWDVDFVVHPADWPALTGILGRLGYAAVGGDGEAAGAGPRLDWTYSPYFRKGPLFLEFLMGLRDYACTPWGMPTYNIFGWQRPCYLLDEGYAKTFRELMEETDWNGYGRASGNPKCGDCMVHCGYEPAAVEATFSSLGGLLATARLMLLASRKVQSFISSPSPGQAVAEPVDQLLVHVLLAVDVLRR